MRTLKGTFRGLNTEISHNSLDSGAASTSLNVEVTARSVRGRRGFAAFDSAGMEGAIRNMTTCSFSDGSVYVVKKCSDGKLYFWKTHPSDDGSWTEVVDRWGGHHGADPGWFFFHMDRLHYFDRVGGTKLDLPNYGYTADPEAWTGCWKSGLLSTVGILPTAADGGEKEGHYRTSVTKMDSRTRAESTMTTPSDVVETRASANQGGLAGSAWASVVGADTDYEYDVVRTYCTAGHTEFFGVGSDENNQKCVSYRMYRDAEQDATEDSISLNKADHILRQSDIITNAGGHPPGSQFGYFNGTRAVYLNCYKFDYATVAPAGSITEGLIQYSLPGYPCMVPQVRTYSKDGDSYGLEPIPWRGEAYSTMGGQFMGIGAVGQDFVVFTDTGTMWLRNRSDGRLVPMIGHQSLGSVSPRGTVTTAFGVHTIGATHWLLANGDGVQNIARYRFTPTLEAVDADHRDEAVMGAFHSRNEVWCAVSMETQGDKFDYDEVQRILIYSEDEGELMSVWEPACMTASHSITAMVELPVPDGTNKMLIATDGGPIYEWPSSSYTDAGTGYVCTWQGTYAQQDRHKDLSLQRALVHAGMLPVAGVDVSVWGVRSAAESESGWTPSVNTTTLTGDNRMHAVGGGGYHVTGNMFKVKFESSAAQTAEWEVDDLVIEYETS